MFEVKKAFTIQNVSIKYKLDAYLTITLSDLQYKMFLLNIECRN